MALEKINKLKRNKDICKELLSGKNYAEVAIEFGLTSERIRQLFKVNGGKLSQVKKVRYKLDHTRALKIVEEFVTKKGYIPNNTTVIDLLAKHDLRHCSSNIRNTIIKKIKLPTSHELLNKKTKENLLNDLKRIYSIYKRPIGKKELAEQKAHSPINYIYHFGSFVNACKIAKVPNKLRGSHRFKKTK